MPATDAQMEQFFDALQARMGDLTDTLRDAGAGEWEGAIVVYHPAFAASYVVLQSDGATLDDVKETVQQAMDREARV